MTRLAQSVGRRRNSVCFLCRRSVMLNRCCEGIEKRSLFCRYHGQQGKRKRRFMLSHPSRLGYCPSAILLNLDGCTRLEKIFL